MSLYIKACQVAAGSKTREQLSVANRFAALERDRELSEASYIEALSIVFKYKILSIDIQSKWKFARGGMAA